MHSLFPEEQLTQARGWANMFVERGLAPPAKEMWLLRQCMRYMPPTMMVNYMSMNVAHQKPEQIEAFWVGEPADWEGAVRMMEASFSTPGWRAVMYPSVQPGYNAEQAARILAVIQQVSDVPRASNLRTREDIFLEAFDGRLKPVPSMDFWKNPAQWLSGHKLKPQEQLTVWCAYAMLADPDILLTVSKALRWKNWEVGEFLLDWDKVTSSDYKERHAAAEQLLAAQNKKASKVALPTNIDFTMQM